MARPALHLPPGFLAWLGPYLAVLSRRSRPTAAALAVGALLAVGPRTATNCPRALGLAWHPGFAAFHRVLNRNAWSGLALARTLLRAVVAAFVPAGPIVIGVDHTLERRRGPHIGPAGRFYDASRRADLPKPTRRSATPRRQAARAGDQVGAGSPFWKSAQSRASLSTFCGFPDTSARVATV